MKQHSFRIDCLVRRLGSLGLSIVLAAGAVTGRATEPADEGDDWNTLEVNAESAAESEVTAGAAAERDAGEPGPFPVESGERYLLLDNDKVMVGTVERAEGGYALVRNGGRIFFEEARVRFVGNSLGEVYRFKTEQVPSHDIPEHMKIHYWCLANRLEAEAVAELRGILEVDPANVAATRRLEHLESKKNSARSTRPRGTESARAARPIAPPDKIVDNFIRGHGQQAFERYNQVERVLLNKCSAGACHGSARHGGGFRLYGIQAGRIRDQRLTARNLQSVQDFIEWKNPERSPILYMALEPHGRLEVAPLGGVNDPMYKELRDWVYAVVDGWNVDASVLAASRPSPPDGEVAASDGFGSARTKPVTGPIQRFQRPGRPITLPGSIVESIDESYAPAADDAPPGTVEGKVLPRTPPERPEIQPGSDPTAPSAAPSNVVPNAVDPFDPASFNQATDTPAPAAAPDTKNEQAGKKPEGTRLAPIRQTVVPEEKGKFFKAPSLPFGLGKKKPN